ncbi:hypothetical protein MY04_2524 [Flammeovirga sp. MY04]|uniref:hypothetical protein n=1 Tax=Flammeovirga sp. MY04 TaxID=1191459 RepID=UPI0008062795|nr:hypothetical protein [Flammeovirga sp. MY04]ANQ49893.1 hypothetical protein MY04_2524 [Flammeovirga sp. MY04]
MNFQKLKAFILTSLILLTNSCILNKEHAIRSVSVKSYLAEVENNKIHKWDQISGYVEVYNEDGKLLYFKKDGGLADEEKKLVYDSSGYLTNEFLTKYGQFQYEKKYQNDSLGQCYEEHIYRANGDSTKIKNTYNSNGELIKKLYYWDWETPHLYTNFQSDDNEKTEKDYKIDGTRWHLVKRNFDKKGRLIRYREYKNFTTQERDTKYTYNKKNDLIKEITYDSSRSVIEESKYSYEYDKNKNWIKKIMYRDEKPIVIDERKIEYF